MSDFQINSLKNATGFKEATIAHQELKEQMQLLFDKTQNVSANLKKVMDNLPQAVKDAYNTKQELRALQYELVQKNKETNNPNQEYTLIPEIEDLKEKMKALEKEFNLQPSLTIEERITRTKQRLEQQLEALTHEERRIYAQVLALNKIE